MFPVSFWKSDKILLLPVRLASKPSMGIISVCMDYNMRSGIFNNSLPIHTSGIYGQRVIDKWSRFSGVRMLKYLLFNKILSYRLDR